jgi:hypothetical protein
LLFVESELFQARFIEALDRASFKEIWAASVGSSSLLFATRTSSNINGGIASGMR